MSRVKQGFSGLSVPEQVERARLIVTKTTGNASYTTPNPALADVSAAATALESAYNDSRSHDKDELAAMRLRRAEMLFIISQLAAYVQQASGGDEEKILSSGFDVMGAKTPHPDVADQVFNVKLNDGSTSGKVKVSFDKAKYAVIYGIQVSEKIDATDWNIAGFTTRTQKEIGNLNPGTKYWIRVAGIGREEVGHPSEPISIIAR